MNRRNPWVRLTPGSHHFSGITIDGSSNAIVAGNGLTIINDHNGTTIIRGGGRIITSPSGTTTVISGNGRVINNPGVYNESGSGGHPGDSFTVIGSGASINGDEPPSILESLEKRYPGVKFVVVEGTREVDVDSAVTIEENAKITLSPGLQIKGHSKIGSQAEIEGGKIFNSTIYGKVSSGTVMRTIVHPGGIVERGTVNDSAIKHGGKITGGRTSYSSVKSGSEISGGTVNDTVLSRGSKISDGEVIKSNLDNGSEVTGGFIKDSMLYDQSKVSGGHVNDSILEDGSEVTGGIVNDSMLRNKSKVSGGSVANSVLISAKISQGQFYGRTIEVNTRSFWELVWSWTRYLKFKAVG